MATFKTGDKVKLLPGHYRDESFNPLWGGKFGNQIGKVDRVDAHSIRVIWDTYLRGNTYHLYEVELIKGDWDE